MFRAVIEELKMINSYKLSLERKILQGRFSIDAAIVTNEKEVSRRGIFSPCVQSKLGRGGGRGNLCIKKLALIFSKFKLCAGT